jgi:hypothetical protein
MPDFFGKHHTEHLQFFYLTGKERIINNITHLWAMDVNSYLFSINLFVKVLPLY